MRGTCCSLLRSYSCRILHPNFSSCAQHLETRDRWIYVICEVVCTISKMIEMGAMAIVYFLAPGYQDLWGQDGRGFGPRAYP